jgi:hypothetical protein
VPVPFVNKSIGACAEPPLGVMVIFAAARPEGKLMFQLKVPVPCESIVPSSRWRTTLPGELAPALITIPFSSPRATWLEFPVLYALTSRL